MSITFGKIAEEDGRSDHLGQKVRRRKRWVWTTEANEDQNAIEAASGYTYYDPHPGNNLTTQTFLGDYDASVIEDLGGNVRKWLEVATFKSHFPELTRGSINPITGTTTGGGGGGSGPGGSSDPTQRFPNFESKSYIIEENITKDNFGNAIETTASEPITGVKQTRGRATHMFNKICLPWDSETQQSLDSLIGWINDDWWYDYPPCVLKIRDVITRNAEVQNGYVPYDFTVIFDVNYDFVGPPGEEVQGWYWLENLNAGYYQLVPPAGGIGPDNREIIKIDGRNASSPQFLDDDGHWLGVGASPTYVYNQVAKLTDFSILPL